MPDPLNSIEASVFGENAERCPKTGRPFERGSGSLPKEQQTANYVQEAEQEARRAADAVPTLIAPTENDLIALVARADRGEQPLN